MSSHQKEHDTRAEAWPSQIRLAGQAAAPPGPVDLSAVYVVHHAVRRDLAVLTAAVAATPVTDRGCWRALAERWGLFAIALEHHAGEDRALWPVLRSRADGAGRAVLAAIEAENDEIDPLLASCDAAFERLVARADDDTRAALAVRLVATRERMGAHLAHEETDANPLIQLTLTPLEWDRLERRELGFGLAPCRLLSLVPWAADGLPATVRRRVFASHGGPTYHALWLLARQRYARRSALALRYVG